MTQLSHAGLTSQDVVVQAQTQLRWAKAMFAGNRLDAALARRDGAKERLALMKRQVEVGALAPGDLMAVERELAEAEALVSELQGADASGGPPGPR